MMKKSWGTACALFWIAALGCGEEITMREACSAVVPAWHLPGAVEGYIDPAAQMALVAAAGLECNEWCQQDILDSATMEELEAAGFLNTPNSRFQHTVWASAGVSYELGEWETDPYSASSLEDGRLLYRREHVARLSVVVDAVPGGLTGEARCWIIEDPESGEWWFWDFFVRRGGGWLAKADPWLQVWFEYDPFLTIPPD